MDKKRKDAIARSFLAFASMVQEVFGVDKALAIKAIAVAYDVNAEPPPPSVMSWHELLLSKFPSFDPTWPDDVKSKWFDSFAALRAAGEKK